jgi:hypothetical protein
MRLFLALCFVLLAQIGVAQNVVTGKIADTQGDPIVGANILVLNDSTGTTTDLRGEFSLNLKQATKAQLQVSHVQYNTKIIEVALSGQKSVRLAIELEEKKELLKELSVTGTEDKILAVSSVRLNPETFTLTPVPFQDISNIIATLPSVTSNNELSTSYSVRGGSYDENLVTVNGINVYRPFLVRAGQEEGLSFVNTDLISSVNFSAGGWSVQYDDKMASVLAANYKNPTEFAGSAMLSLLGAKAHVEGTFSEKFSYLAGVRHKSNAYLLNTLDVDGDYRPTFTDAQLLLKGQISSKSTLEVLLAFANNNYSVTPSQSTTSFGTFNKELRLQVAFDGKQEMKYRTYQGALKHEYIINKKLIWTNLASISSYNELENIDVEGGYRLCDVDKNTASDTFNECITTRGIGTLYNYARNSLTSVLIDAESNLSYNINASQDIRVGINYSRQSFNDNINEYGLIDSANYISVEQSILAQNETSANLLKAYFQHSIDLNTWAFTYGARINYNTLNKYTLISPRVLIGYRPENLTNLKFNFGVGLYGQQPFYKEFRKIDGSLNTDVKGQSSLHFNLAMHYDITWWGRPFQLTTEVYYKYLWNQIPYIIENVRQQYFPDYTAQAKSMGFEARLGGEFIPGTESWFSFGLMSAREKIPGVDEDFIRRPTDQRFKVAFIFEDHIPGDPSLRVNLSFQYGSGLPISAPENLEQRNSFTGDDYSRLDIGFSKLFNFNEKFFKYARVGVEINNLFGSRNAVSYTWITDINAQQFAVPNYLTGRLFNVVVSTEF